MGDQHSALRVKLSDIVEGMDFQSDEQSSFLNLTTAEVVSVTTEEFWRRRSTGIVMQHCKR